MSLRTFRKDQKMSQDELGRAIGRSKGFVSGLESGALRAQLRTALQLEDMSEGIVAADALLEDDDRELLQRHRERVLRMVDPSHAA